jgi:hypothetical protein
MANITGATASATGGGVAIGKDATGSIIITGTGNQLYIGAAQASSRPEAV